jgi:hypothetical protein
MMEISRMRHATTLALGLVLCAAAASAGTLTVRPGVPNVGGVARFSGTQGLEINVASPNTSPAFVQSSHPSAEGTYRARFYVNLRNLAMGEGDEFDLLSAYDGADAVPPAVNGSPAFRLVVRRVSGVNRLSAYARLNSGNESQIGATVTLANGWREIEANWAKATAAGANNGRLDLWVDGVARTGLTGLNNDLETVNYVRWGSVNGVDAATSGTIRLDDFASQRTGYIGPVSIFSDEPTTDAFWPYIQGLYQAEITTGCATGQFCPLNSVTRAEMAVFLVRAMHGPTFVPPAGTGIFSDAPVGYWAIDYIEQLYHDGITTGCANAPLRFCPGTNINRAEMAVFLLRAKHGSSYTPPAATGAVFTDVPASYWAVNWIERLYAEGITTGCAAGKYCPGDVAQRLQMAAFLCRTFGFPQPQVGP